MVRVYESTTAKERSFICFGVFHGNVICLLLNRFYLITSTKSKKGEAAVYGKKQ